MELVAPGRACHQKRVVEFGEYLCEEILKAVPHRHFILSIPKILRRYFLYDRSLLSDLSRCGWDSLKAFFQEAVSEEGAVPGAVIAIQSFGDFLGFNSHLHVLSTDGCFYGQGMFRVAPRFETKQLEEIFPAKDGIFDRHKVFKLLLSKGKITQDLVNMLMSWPPARRAYASESAILVLISSVDQGYNRGRKRLWKIWPDTSFVPSCPACVT